MKVTDWIFCSRIYQMKNYVASFNVPEKGMSQTNALSSSLNETRDILRERNTNDANECMTMKKDGADDTTTHTKSESFTASTTT